MSNVVAAIGLAQVEKADEYRAMRIRNHQLYRKFLSDVPGVRFQAPPAPDCVDVCWMNTIVVDPAVYGHGKDDLIAHLKEQGIDTRLLFTGMHRQKAMRDFGCDCSGDYPVCDWLTENGFYLPSGSNLQEAQIERICDVIRKFANV
jgi:perosamine synthetase